jgi:hypothetical protein
MGGDFPSLLFIILSFVCENIYFSLILILFYWFFSQKTQLVQQFATDTWLPLESISNPGDCGEIVRVSIRRGRHLLVSLVYKNRREHWVCWKRSGIIYMEAFSIRFHQYRIRVIKWGS